MIGSLYSGISGLDANTQKLSVIGDNIANINTTGFKASDVSFANVFTESMGTGDGIGRGVVVSGISQDWSPGSLEDSDSATDLAVNGNGMFVVSDEATGVTYYTRSGNFAFDKAGDLTTADGLMVQGYAIDSTGQIGSLGNITMPGDVSEPSATTEISFTMNLDADAADGDVFDSTITVYDSLGSAVELTCNFTYDSANTEWDWTVTPSSGACATTGSLSFDTDGSLDAATEGGGNPTIALTGLSGADLSIDWVYLNSSATSDGTLTGYASSSVTTNQSQDGYVSGYLQGVSVDEDGYFIGQYSNGEMTTFAQITLANFANYDGLAKVGGNLYTTSLESGVALLGLPGSAGMGSITPGALEMANVDLANEFIEMIISQRAFQASSKVITTSDEVLSDLINLKR